MSEQKASHVINVAAVAGHRVWAGSAVYSATKAGVRAISEGLRQEAKPYGLRVTVIWPGSVATEQLDAIRDPATAEAVRSRVEPVALPADSFARMVASRSVSPRRSM